jgi:hypothetical protein
MSMNKIIFKLWIDAKRASLKRELELGIESKEYLKGRSGRGPGLPYRKKFLISRNIS